MKTILQSCIMFQKWQDKFSYWGFEKAEVSLYFKNSKEIFRFLRNLNMTTIRCHCERIWKTRVAIYHFVIFLKQIFYQKLTTFFDIYLHSLIHLLLFAFLYISHKILPPKSNPKFPSKIPLFSPIFRVVFFFLFFCVFLLCFLNI